MLQQLKGDPDDGSTEKTPQAIAEGIATVARVTMALQGQQLFA